jgi:anti-sigma-K factor RskA
MSREHLDAAALARAVVDDQSVLDSRHLSSCAQCQEELADLQTGLARLSRRARQTAPSTASCFVWPQTARPKRGPAWKWLLSPVAGAVAMALLLAVVWVGLRNHAPQPLAWQVRETGPWAEIMDDDSDRLGGFAGFLVAENSTWQDQDFISAGDEVNETGAEGVILWPGVL